MKKLILYLLLAAMLTSAVSCGGSAAPSGDTTASGGEGVTTPALTGRDAVSDDLPAKNFGGEKFNMLTRTVYDYEFGAVEENGDLVNDAVYKRNITVEERFNVDIVTIPVDCKWGDQATAFNTMLKSSIMAGDGAYDLVAGYAATIPNLVGENLFMNWAEIDYIDFSKPWWSEGIAEELTINGKCFLATGDISLALWKGMTCFFFNKRLADEYKLGDIYSTVENGDWTLDKLIEFTANTYEDLNGDSKLSTEDKYGFLCMRDTEVDNMKEAFELRVAEKGAGGFPEIVFKNERTIEIVTRLNAYIHEGDSVYFPESGGAAGRSDLAKMFSENRGVFITTTLGVSETLRGMNDDFGIIPYPKYDKSQKEYHATSLDEFSLFVVPIDVKNMEKTAIITEALCAESYKQVVPTFYDIALKTKAARDDDSAAMIDLIRDGLVFDFGYLHSSALGGVGHCFVNLIRNNDNNVVSTYDSKAASYQTNLEKVLEVYR